MPPLKVPCRIWQSTLRSLDWPGVTLWTQIIGSPGMVGDKFRMRKIVIGVTSDGLLQELCCSWLSSHKTNSASRLNQTKQSCKYKLKVDHRSYTHNLSSCEIKTWKKNIQAWTRTHDLRDTGAVLYQAIWQLVILWVRNIPVENEECNFTTAQVVCITTMINHKFISFSVDQIDTSYINLQNSDNNIDFHLRRIRQTAARLHKWNRNEERDNGILTQQNSTISKPQ